MNDNLLEDAARLEKAARQELTRLAAELPMTRAVDWGSVSAGLHRSRRRRRLRRLAGATAALGVAALFAGGLPRWTGLTSSTDPAGVVSIVPSPLDGASALARQPTKGSLAHDTAWLAGLRQRVIDLTAPPLSDRTGLSCRGLAANQMSILYAADLGGIRLAVVELPCTVDARGLSRGRIWLTADAGSAPGRMEISGALWSNLPDPMGMDIGDRMVGVDPTRTVLRRVVVLTSTSATVWAQNSVSYGADGQQSIGYDAVPATEPGVHIYLAEKAHGAVTVTAGGQEWPLAASQEAAAEITARIPNPSRRIDSARLQEFVRGGLTLARATPTDLTPALTIFGPDNSMVAVLTLRTSSGTTIAVAGHAEAQFAGGIALDGALVIPVGRPMTLAWHLIYEGNPTDRFAVMGPSDARRVELLDSSNQTLGSFEVQDGHAVITSPQARAATTVRFLDTSDRVLATTALRDERDHLARLGAPFGRVGG